MRVSVNYGGMNDKINRAQSGGQEDTDGERWKIEHERKVFIKT